MEVVDRKFQISAVCREHGHLFSEADAVLFVAKDKALPATLRFYLEECRRLGAAERQLEGIALLIARVEAWQVANPGRVKVPDVDAGPLGDMIVAPNRAT
jgi:hypothetical protein